MGPAARALVSGTPRRRGGLPESEEAGEPSCSRAVVLPRGAFLRTRAHAPSAAGNSQRQLEIRLSHPDRAHDLSGAAHTLIAGASRPRRDGVEATDALRDHSWRERRPLAALSRLPQSNLVAIERRGRPRWESGRGRTRRRARHRRGWAPGHEARAPGDGPGRIRGRRRGVCRPASVPRQLDALRAAGGSCGGYGRRPPAASMVHRPRRSPSVGAPRRARPLARRRGGSARHSGRRPRSPRARNSRRASNDVVGRTRAWRRPSSEADKAKPFQRQTSVAEMCVSTEYVATPPSGREALATSPKPRHASTEASALRDGARRGEAPDHPGGRTRARRGATHVFEVEVARRRSTR